MREVRFWLVVFMVGLVLSGVTAFPLQREVNWLVSEMRGSGMMQGTGLLAWLERVNEGLAVTNARYPFLAYGTDWLAFAHLVIAVVFIGPFVDPVRNKWVVCFGLIACAAVVPLALIAGAVRGIPFGWRMVDCSFGVAGYLPLWRCCRLIERMEGAGR